jgi:hypothetical protein
MITQFEKYILEDNQFLNSIKIVYEDDLKSNSIITIRAFHEKEEVGSVILEECMGLTNC